jgi:hypothetical protein
MMMRSKAVLDAKRCFKLASPVSPVAPMIVTGVATDIAVESELAMYCRVKGPRGGLREIRKDA